MRRIDEPSQTLGDIRLIRGKVHPLARVLRKVMDLNRRAGLPTLLGSHTPPVAPANSLLEPWFVELPVEVAVGVGRRTAAEQRIQHGHPVQARGSACLVSSAKVGSMSQKAKTSSGVPGLIWPGQHAMNGTRMPPS